MRLKKKLSQLFSGELNPFWSKKHNSNSLNKMSKSKIGELNPMFGKPKSKEFIEQMYKDKTGANNPMSKKVYVYDAITKEFIKCYDSRVSAVQDLNISKVTINKYIDTLFLDPNYFIQTRYKFLCALTFFFFYFNIIKVYYYLFYYQFATGDATSYKWLCWCLCWMKLCFKFWICNLSSSFSYFLICIIYSISVWSIRK